MVRDEALVLVEKLHRGREQKLGLEINDLQHRCRHSPNNSELKYMWGLEAKVEAQFAFMRRLMRTEGFVMRTMADFDGLDIDGSDMLDPQELQEFVKKRDGFQTKFTIVDARARQLLSDLDVDGDGKVSRVEWIIYMTYLHWMSFTEETVVEKVVEVTKEYKNDKSGSPVMIESIVQHPGRQLPKPGDQTLANQRGGGVIAQNLPCLERVRSQITENQQRSGLGGFGKAPPVVESLRQNPDGSYVTTFEHNNPTFGNKGWCL
jgi:hypothetical protein